MLGEKKPSSVIKEIEKEKKRKREFKEIVQNNRMGKTRYLFKKIRDTKGKFHAKLGTIKDRNGMDLTEANAIKNT